MKSSNSLPCNFLPLVFLLIMSCFFLGSYRGFRLTLLSLMSFFINKRRSLPKSLWQRHILASPCYQLQNITIFCSISKLFSYRVSQKVKLKPQIIGCEIDLSQNLGSLPLYLVASPLTQLGNTPKHRHKYLPVLSLGLKEELVVP